MAHHLRVGQQQALSFASRPLIFSSEAGCLCEQKNKISLRAWHFFPQLSPFLFCCHKIIRAFPVLSCSLIGKLVFGLENYSRSGIGSPFHSTYLHGPSYLYEQTSVLVSCWVVIFDLTCFSVHHSFNVTRSKKKNSGLSLTSSLSLGVPVPWATFFPLTFTFFILLVIKKMDSLREHRKTMFDVTVLYGIPRTHTVSWDWNLVWCGVRVGTRISTLTPHQLILSWVSSDPSRTPPETGKTWSNHKLDTLDNTSGRPCTRSYTNLISSRYSFHVIHQIRYS